LGSTKTVFEQYITTMAAVADFDHLNDRSILNWPIAVEAILRDTADIGFSMASESQTGSLLRTFAASRPAGQFLELGIGTGVATAWLLDGMDQASRLQSVDNDPTVVAIARRHLGSDPRVTFHLDDGAAFIERQAAGSYDFVFADAWPGKFSHFEQALRLSVGQPKLRNRSVNRLSVAEFEDRPSRGVT
jgi:predicted O-methyltransferase YrrM